MATTSKIDFTKRLSKIDKKRDVLNKETSQLVEEFMASVKIEKVFIEQTQEYDDNNYYTNKSIAVLKTIDDEVGNLCDVNIGHFHLDEDIPMALEELEKIRPSNSLRMIKDSKNKWDDITYEQVSDITLGKLVLFCFKNNIDIEVMNGFILTILDTPDNALPSKFFEDN